MEIASVIIAILYIIYTIILLVLISVQALNIESNQNFQWAFYEFESDLSAISNLYPVVRALYRMSLPIILIVY